MRESERNSMNKKWLTFFLQKSGHISVGYLLKEVLMQDIDLAYESYEGLDFKISKT